MNYQLLAAAENHATVLNTLQSAILYDLCRSADSEGRAKVDVKELAYRWRVHPTTVKSMLREIQAAGFVSSQGSVYAVLESLLECPNGCICPLAPTTEPYCLVPNLTLGEEKAKAKKEKLKKVWSVDNPPDPGSVYGIYEKLKGHFRNSRNESPPAGVIERALGDTIRRLHDEGGGNLVNFERAFVNYLKFCENGPVKLVDFANVWGDFVNNGSAPEIKSEAVSSVKSAFEGVEL